MHKAETLFRGEVLKLAFQGDGVTTQQKRTETLRLGHMLKRCPVIFLDLPQRMAGQRTVALGLQEKIVATKIAEPINSEAERGRHCQKRRKQHQ